MEHVLQHLDRHILGDLDPDLLLLDAHDLADHAVAHHHRIAALDRLDHRDVVALPLLRGPYEQQVGEEQHAAHQHEAAGRSGEEVLDPVVASRRGRRGGGKHEGEGEAHSGSEEALRRRLARGLRQGWRKLVTRPSFGNASPFAYETGMNDASKDAPRTVMARIASALERLAPRPAAAVDFRGARLFRHDPASGAFVPAPDFALALDLLVGVERQKLRFLENLERFAGGLPANHVLLW